LVKCFNFQGYHVIVTAISAVFSSRLLLFVTLMIITAWQAFPTGEEDGLDPFTFYGFY